MSNLNIACSLCLVGIIIFELNVLKRTLRNKLLILFHQTPQQQSQTQQNLSPTLKEFVKYSMNKHMLSSILSVNNQQLLIYQMFINGIILNVYLSSFSIVNFSYSIFITGVLQLTILMSMAYCNQQIDSIPIQINEQKSIFNYVCAKKLLPEIIYLVLSCILLICSCVWIRNIYNSQLSGFLILINIGIALVIDLFLVRPVALLLESVLLYVIYHKNPSQFAKKYPKIIKYIDNQNQKNNQTSDFKGLQKRNINNKITNENGIKQILHEHTQDQLDTNPIIALQPIEYVTQLIQSSGNNLIMQNSSSQGQHTSPLRFSIQTEENIKKQQININSSVENCLIKQMEQCRIGEDQGRIAYNQKQNNFIESKIQSVAITNQLPIYYQFQKSTQQNVSFPNQIYSRLIQNSLEGSKQMLRESNQSKQLQEMTKQYFLMNSTQDVSSKIDLITTKGRASEISQNQSFIIKPTKTRLITTQKQVHTGLNQNQLKQIKRRQSIRNKRIHLIYSNESTLESLQKGDKIKILDKQNLLSNRNTINKPTPSNSEDIKTSSRNANHEIKKLQKSDLQFPSNDDAYEQKKRRRRSNKRKRQEQLMKQKENQKSPYLQFLPKILKRNELQRNYSCIDTRQKTQKMKSPQPGTKSLQNKKLLRRQVNNQLFIIKKTQPMQIETVYM